MVHLLNACFELAAAGHRNLRAIFIDDDVADYEEVVDEAMQDGEARYTSLTRGTGFRNFAHSHRAVRLCIFHGLCYYALAILGFSVLVENWSVLDSVYFATVVFTTIGYGDIAPTTLSAQVFTILLALYGIVMIGIFLGVIGEILLEKAEARKDQQSQQLMSEVLKTCKNSRGGGGGSNSSSNDNNDNQVSSSTATREVLEPDRQEQGPAGVNSSGGKPKSSSTESLGQVIWNIVKLELPVVGALLLVALWVGWMEGWSIIGSLYWLVVTGTTVGFGDYHPTLPATRLFCIFFLPIAVAVLGKLLARIASAYMDGKVKRQEKEFLSRSLALCDLQVMDTDANGHVDLAEFLTYMLVALQKVNKDDIREIREVFDRLDVDKSGVLTINDLKTQAWDLTMKDSMMNLYGAGIGIGTGGSL